jgi:hypothetical protein
VFGPFKVSFANGASSQNVVIGNGGKSGSGTINVSLQGAHIHVEGANSRVNISTGTRSQ